LGIRVPFIAVSPFSKPGYVSHAVGDHTSLLALIERRFLTINGVTLHLTKRDEHANPLEDMFDFEHSPSLNTPLTEAEPPANDCLFVVSRHDQGDGRGLFRLAHGARAHQISLNRCFEQNVEVASGCAVGQ
jgi:phospholipase C